MIQEIHLKAEEKTPRLVKKILLFAYLLYFLTAAALAIATSANHWQIWLAVALAFSSLGITAQYLIAKAINWYLTG